MSEFPFQDPSLDPAERAHDLLGRLTLEEKAGQLTQYFYFGVELEAGDDVDVDSLPPEVRVFYDAPRKVLAALDRGGAGSLLFVKDPALRNNLQRRAIEGSRLGIPLIFAFDVIHGMRTIFPVPIAMAASWDPAAAEAAQKVAAREARAVGIRWTFAPMIDIARDPRWGRIIEGAGEDPVLGAAMAAAQVRGFQGDGGEETLFAGPKHFAGYGAALGGRDYDDADISDSQLHNVYLEPFLAAIEAGAANIMSAYMDLNGVPASGNKNLLTTILRKEFRFDGWVVSDANAVKSLETQHFARNGADAAQRALEAGLDMEMCMFDPAYSHLPDLVNSGKLDEALLDQSVLRVLTAKFASGVFENPYIDEDAVDAVWSAPAHREESARIAERTFVLLENNGVLPLAADTKKIAVIGDLAQSKRDIVGPWVFAQDNSESVSVLEGIQARAGDNVEVVYERGLATAQRVHTSMFDNQETDDLPSTPEGFDEDAAIDAAVKAAKEAEIAIVVVGQNQNMIGERASASTLDLPGRQNELVEKVSATGTPVVVLVMSGRPLDLRLVKDHAAAILQIWYPGTRGGEAVARVLFGDVSPAGRLPYTWPHHVGQIPIHYAHYRTFQPEEQHQRYWNEQLSLPLYPFGYGKSYATFEYSPLRVPERMEAGDVATIGVTVTNTSPVDADEVVQLYIHQKWGMSTRPIRELKGFRRVHVPAGQSVDVEFELGPKQLQYWSDVSRLWGQDSDTEIDIAIGGDSLAEFSATIVVNE
ncbi:MAG: glycoside hydrolase family 3 N-terminal domain-containing protein [Actinomycetaceae bacterium]|nr:glycoside hydrolase family 3 N-terminal domain-containing protein [Actinomycetaceae bacterium]